MSINQSNARGLVSLPIPDTEAKALSDQVLSLIKAEIQKSGSIPFSRYMELALYAPQLGYYKNNLKKFGRNGDFITAPEMSPFFSYCIANQCAQVLENLNGGDILEFGAGSGIMAADILCALKNKNQLPKHYYIVELSAFLKALQKETILQKIPELIDRVIWLDQLPSTPIEGVVLANEVLDAMPVCQFIMRDGIKECAIKIENDQLVSFISENKNDALISQVEQYDIHFDENYMSEVNLNLQPWIASVSAVLSKGVVLMIDYGFPRHEYYHPERSMGTLMCHFRHFSHPNPLVFPGIQDITAHVDFTAVAEAASDNSFEVVGFTNQAAFLINCGLLNFHDESLDEKKRLMQNQQILQLTSLSEMGELFKVMGLLKNVDMPLIGFQTMNQLMRL